MDEKDLEGFLRREGVWLLEEAPDDPRGGRLEGYGIPLERITKSLVFKADGEPVVAAAPGDRRVDAAKAVGAKKVELAPFGEAEKFSGYPPGGTTPTWPRSCSTLS